MTDVTKLNEVIRRLADADNSLVIVESNLDVIETAAADLAGVGRMPHGAGAAHGLCDAGAGGAAAGAARRADARVCCGPCDCPRCGAGLTACRTPAPVS